ncbi:hypothetical protein AYO38_03315 [bacterium SCGC AG-212-C10]|nr:hypothetical protein AYO38_03315 [bacterium SCGC AG-212-C10]
MHGHALPGDRPKWPRDRVVDLRHLKLEVKLDIPGKAVRGTASHTVSPMNDGLREVTFDAVDMDIAGVTIDGEEARFSYDGREVRVHLTGAHKRGDELTVAITFTSHPRLGLYFIAPDEQYPDKPVQVWSQGQDEDSRHWFPCYDTPNDKQTSEMIATVPANWMALSNGRMAGDVDNGDGTRTVHWSQERPHSTYLVTLAAGEFARIDASRPDLPIDYFVEPSEVEKGERTFKNTPEMISLFERVTGVAYPWAKYSQIVVRDFIFGGMENTSATTMFEDILLDRKASRDFSSDDLVSHELAHMWFGDLLTCRDWSHGWLNESFATYLEMLWDEEKRGVDEYRQGVLTNTELYLGERYRRPIVSNIWNEPIDVFDRHLYEKGSLVLNTLRGLLGDDQFFRSIQRYVRDNQERSVITQDLANAVEAETGRNIEWFFDQWVFKPGHPELKVSWAWDESAKTASVTVKQTQKTDNGTPIYRIPVTIDFRAGRGKAQAFKVEINEQNQTFLFALQAKPDLCRFDPYNRVLKVLDFEKSTGELRLQLAEDDDIAGRVAAAEGLGKKGGVDAINALEAAVMGDRFWSVQAAAAKALGTIKGDAARDALLRSLAVKSLKAKRAVVTALGEFRGDQLVFDSIAPIAARDQSWFVEAAACRSIGKLRLPQSYDVLAANIDRPSFRGVVRTACADGLVDARDERGIALITAATKYGSPAASRRWATGALSRISEFFDSRKSEIGETLVDLLDDPDFRVRMAAANGFRVLKDAKYAAALDRMAQRELDGRGVRVAREVAGILRKGANTSDEVKTLREEFEKLRDENTRLRDRLAKLELAEGPQKKTQAKS